MSQLIKRLIQWSCFALLLIYGANACGQHGKQDPHYIKVGTVAGPETELMEVAKQIAHDKYGLKVEIVTFNDYNLPNIALEEESIDANMFQHEPFLEQAIKTHGYHMTAIGKTFVYPMGIYSQRFKGLYQLGNGAVVAIPNDPTNEGRALLLLQKAKLITLKQDTFTATPLDVAENPKSLQFRELDAAQLPRALPDVDIAVINTNYIIPAGLLPSRDALFVEDKQSPYANVVVVKTKNKDQLKFKQLMMALHDEAVVKKAQDLFKGQAIKAW